MSTTGWWILGYALAGVVVLIAATLLIAIILFARRIVAQTAAITRALDGAMRNTNPLFDLANLNHALGSMPRYKHGSWRSRFPSSFARSSAHKGSNGRHNGRPDRLVGRARRCRGRRTRRLGPARGPPAHRRPGSARRRRCPDDGRTPGSEH